MTWARTSPPGGRPGCSHAAGTSGGASLCWHHIPRTNTWVGTKRPYGERPLILEEPYMMLAELADRRGYVAWEGTAVPNRTPKPRQIDNGRFYFCAEPGGSGGPT